MMKISEFAEFTQRSPRTLRLYEELGLLTPHQRTAGGFRLYHAEQAVRLVYIDKLQSLGCSLSDIQTLLESWRTQPTAAAGMKALEDAYREKLNEVTHALHQLKAIEHELKESLEFLQGCHHCKTLAQPEKACAHCDRTEDELSPLIKGISNPKSSP